MAKIQESSSNIGVHFKRDFDEMLPTFKNIMSRLSTSRHSTIIKPDAVEPINSNQQQQQQPQQQQQQQQQQSTTSSSSRTATATPHDAGKAKPSFNSSSSMIKTMPNELTNHFKCVILAREGQKPR